MTSVAAVVVTHDSERWIETTLRSIVDQSRTPDAVVIIDDASTDHTLDIVAKVMGNDVEVRPTDSTASDRITRIAQNFEQGVRACEGHDIVVLGDHDDIWHESRVDHQVTLLGEYPTASMVASDGTLVDTAGQPVGGRLRTVFPVDEAFNVLSPAQQMRFTLRHSIATGGASALRPALFPDLSVPPDWLHDRWWSLVATAQESMLVDDTVVIDYRVTESQEVGLDRGTQDSGGMARAVRAGGSQGTGAYRKLRTLQTRLGPLCTVRTRSEIGTRSLVRNLLQKA